MKILIFSILVFLSMAFQASAWNPMVAGSGNQAGCVIPESPDVSYETTDKSNVLTTDAEGQTFDSGSGGTVARICLNIDHSSNGTLDLRLDSEVDMSDGVIEDFGTSATITEDGWVCWDSVTNPTLTASTTYIIGVAENSGDLSWFANAGGGYADGAPVNVSSGWVLGTIWGEAADDNNFRVYYCD